MGKIRMVAFGLNDQVFGIDTSQVLEIIRYSDVTRMSDMPKFVDGVTNLRGSEVPVIDLNKRFELGATEYTKKTKIVIVKINDICVGFIVNDVSEILELSTEEIEVTPQIISQTGNSYIVSVAKKDGKLISIIDINKILNHNEIKSLSANDKK